MQATATLSRAGLIELVRFVFDSGEPTVFQAYSAYGELPRQFETASELAADIELKIAKGERFLFYEIYYPDSLGRVTQRKISLNPKKCAGHTWRYSVEGWGLILLQADLRQTPKVLCRVAVNSQRRAEIWASTFSDVAVPDSWNWRVVEKQARRIIRRMKKTAERGGPVGGRQPNRSKTDRREEEG